MVLLLDLLYLMSTLWSCTPWHGRLSAQLSVMASGVLEVPWMFLKTTSVTATLDAPDLTQMLFGQYFWSMMIGYETLSMVTSSYTNLVALGDDLESSYDLMRRPLVVPTSVQPFTFTSSTSFSSLYL